MSGNDDEEPLSPMSPKINAPSRPLIVRKQSSRLWDQDVSGDNEGSNMESMLSPPRNPLSPNTITQNEGRIRSDRSNKLWSAAASTLSPHQQHRKSVREVALAHNIEGPTLGNEDDESSEGDSITSNVSEKLVEQAGDLVNETHDDGIDKTSALGAFADAWRHNNDPSPEKKSYKMSKGKDDNVLNRWRRIVLCAVHLRFADCAGQQEDSFHHASESEAFPMATGLALSNDTGGGGHSPSIDLHSNKHKISSKPGDQPTRRATLFGSIVGIYRSAIQEGVVNVFHCLGDDIHQISQCLRVKKR